MDKPLNHICQNTKSARLIAVCKRSITQYRKPNLKPYQTVYTVKPCKFWYSSEFIFHVNRRNCANFVWHRVNRVWANFLATSKANLGKEDFTSSCTAVAFSIASCVTCK